MVTTSTIVVIRGVRVNTSAIVVIRGGGGG